MKKFLGKIKSLSKSHKYQLIVAIVLTIAAFALIPAYAWFSNQRKAAEMFKVEFPNALYINAAHREDRIYFNLDGININEYKVDPITKKLVVDANNDPVIVSKMAYVFSVSGSNTNTFAIQMGHTTNNQFRYTIYEAEQFDNSSDAETAAGGAANRDRIVRYTQHAGSHTENTLLVDGDPVVDSATTDLYYVQSAAPLGGRYLNPGTTSGTAATSGQYYFNTYGDNTNVQLNAVPMYWQSDEIPVTTQSNKNFCKYYILIVDWDRNQQSSLESKESDLIYFSVKRRS